LRENKYVEAVQHSCDHIPVNHLAALTVTSSHEVEVFRTFYHFKLQHAAKHARYALLYPILTSNLHLVIVKDRTDTVSYAMRGENADNKNKQRVIALQTKNNPGRAGK
jgi:hypothetical protein